MDVYRNGQPVPESELLGQLIEIRNSTQTQEFPVGILTSDSRTQWANARQRLMKGREKINQFVISIAWYTDIHTTRSQLGLKKPAKNARCACTI